MKRKQLLCLLLAFTLVLTTFAGCGGKAANAGSGDNTAQSASEERKQTLYVTGLAYEGMTGFNLMSGNSLFPTNNANNMLLYETLFGYNSVNGELAPIVGDSYTWKDDLTMTVKINPAAAFSDGKPLTSADVVYSYYLGKKYEIPWSSSWLNLTDVKAVDETTIDFYMSKEHPNKTAVLEAICSTPLYPKHIWEKLEAENNNDIGKLMALPNENPIGSGPYTIKFHDDSKVVCERNDNYWGKVRHDGRLPAPKYITHLLFKSNDAANLAFKEAQLDYSQDFIPNIWKMWEEGLPVKTYLDKEPYYTPDSIPSIWFNLEKPGLNNPEVRRAIAYAIDYENIVKLAMNGYSDPVIPALVLNTPSEQKLVDMDALKPLQWTTDIAKANEILDKLNAKPGADGIRVLPDGTRLGPWDIECPFGWSDWNASLEIVMQNCKKIGIELRTKFPEEPVYTNDRNTGKFDIIMSTPADVISPSQPWLRIRDLMYSKDVPVMGEQAFRNFNRFKNAEADRLIVEASRTEDPAELRKIYTELNLLWLKEVPTIPLMYRPMYFYNCNETYWTNFPTGQDGRNLPGYLFDGAGILGLYDLKAK